MKRLCYLLFACICLTAMPLFAVDYTWNVAGGYVDDPLSWLQNSGYPGGTASDNATIDNGGIATIDATHFFGGPIQQLTAGNTSSGAILQNGGVIVLNNGLEIARAAGSYGYYQLSSGTATATGGDGGACNVMVGDYGVGVYSQTGGTMTAAPIYTVVGWHGGSSVTSQMSVTGGNFNTNGGLFLIGWGSSGIVNIGGTGDMNLGTGAVQMTNIDTGHLNPTAIINLGSVGTGGGILRTSSVHRFDRWDVSFGENYQSTVNFHGGTLQATGVNTDWWCHGFLCTKNAYIYGEGATIDTNGFDETVITSLDAPTGQGITEIAILDPGSGYIGEPIITITPAEGDTGVGATARAILNGSGGIDHIEITNPGVGYTMTPTITFTGGGGTVPTLNTVTLADNVSGGLTKTGLGKLTLNADCTYTGATTVEAGTLYINQIAMASSGIVVQNTATLAGVSSTFAWGILPATTVETGGKIAPGTVGQVLYLNSLNLADGAMLDFKTATGGLSDRLEIVGGDVLPSGTTGDVVVTVNYDGTVNAPTQLLLSSGYLSPNVLFQLSAGLPKLDSQDGINTPVSLVTATGYGGTVTLVPGGAIADPKWNVLAGGSYNTPGNWDPNSVPNGGGQRAMFTNALGSATINVSLDTSPQLSSMIFASPLGESYKITPTDTNSITLDSTIAQNWHISVLSGTHEVGASLKLQAGTGESAIRLADGSKLTLSGVLADATTSAGVNFVGNFNGGTGTGVLKLSGNSTYTGPTIATSGVLEVTKFANAGAASSLGATTDASPANLVLNNATLRYIGTTASSTDRGVTLQGNVAIQLAANAAINGQISGDASTFLTISGAGTLTCGYAGTVGNTIGRLSVTNGSLSLSEGAQLTASSRGDIGNLGTGHVTVSSTSTTAPAKLSIAQASWMGVNYPEGTPSSAVIELSGTGEMHIGTAHPYENVHLGFGTDSSGTITMTGNSKFTVESANPNANMSWGWFNMGDMGATANITLSNNASFAVTQSQMCIAGSTGGKGHVTLNGSATFSVAGAVHMNGWDTTVGDEAVINLNGGSFAASQFIAEAGAGSVINFNGGALKATANSGDFIALRNATASIALNVQAGGAKIDTDGYNVQVSRSLQHDPASGAPAIDGGLTKLGAGTLGLHSQSSYTGSTVVNDGTLQLLSGVTTQLASTPDNMKGDREDGAYSLGRDFTVNTGKSIQVTQLGVFDSLGDGLEASHVVHISSIDGLTDYAVKTFASGTANPYQRGFRFITLDAPLSLTEGTYRVWVDTIGGDGNDFFSGTLATLDAGITGAVTIGGSYYGSPAGSMPTTGWNDGSGSANADATFSFYDPSGFIAANALPITTPVVLGGATGSTPALDLNGMDQQVASLADVAGAAVLGTVTNSKPSVPVVLTLGAESGSKTYTGAITGNLSLVKDGGSMQSLLGALTYVGDTTVNAGELIVTNLNTPANTVSVMDGATLTATSIVADTLVIGGTPSPAPLAVPEPGTFALLVFAAFGALLAWRRK